MKIQVTKLGPLEQAEFELGAMTIICGKNNTGKTYATYALFGFFALWRGSIFIQVPDKQIRQLLNKGAIELDIQEYVENAEKTLEDGCSSFTRQFFKIFASRLPSFSESEFMVRLESSEIHLADHFKRTMRTDATQLFSISKTPESSFLNVSLLVEKKKIEVPREIIGWIVGNALKEIIFGNSFPTPFIVSTERTGAAIFRNEIKIPRDRLAEQLEAMEMGLSPLELLAGVYSDYALPIKTNLDFSQQLEEIAKKDSFITTRHKDILDDFTDIIGGDCLITRNNELYYVPKGTKIKLTINESSSSVRSLLAIGFYLKHVAQPGDLLMVDKPELNLHPENQRRLARLFVRLVNLGIKVFMTTHSDYIIKELNTLIMLNHDPEHLVEIMETEGYRREELLSIDKIRVYIAEKRSILKKGNKNKSAGLTLVPADIDSRLGIEVTSFDDTIDQMNRIQEAILFNGGES